MTGSTVRRNTAVTTCEDWPLLVLVAGSQWGVRQLGKDGKILVVSAATRHAASHPHTVANRQHTYMYIHIVHLKTRAPGKSRAHNRALGNNGEPLLPCHRRRLTRQASDLDFGSGRCFTHFYHFLYPACIVSLIQRLMCIRPRHPLFQGVSLTTRSKPCCGTKCCISLIWTQPPPSNPTFLAGSTQRQLETYITRDTSWRRPTRLLMCLSVLCVILTNGSGIQLHTQSTDDSSQSLFNQSRSYAGC